MFLSYTLSFLKNNKVKLAILLLSISLYFAFVAVVIALNRSIPAIVSLPFSKIGAETIVQKSGQIPDKMEGAIFPHSNGPIYTDELERLEKLPFVQKSDNGLYFWFFEPNRFEDVLGVNENGKILPDILEANILQGNYTLDGNNILITQDFAQKNNLTLGNSITIDNHQFSISGIVPANSSGDIVPADIYMNMPNSLMLAKNSQEMQKLFNFGDKDIVNVVLLKTDPQWQGNKESAVQGINKDLLVFGDKNFSEEIMNQLKIISSSGQILLAVLGIIILAAFILLTVYNIKSREKEIGILRIIGWDLKSLRKHFLEEWFLLMAFALVIGNIFAISGIYFISQQKVSMEIPWEISAKPHFLPTENNIARTVTAQIPVSVDWKMLFILSLIFFAAVAFVSYIILSNRIKRIKPARFLVE